MPTHFVIADNHATRQKELAHRLDSWNLPHCVVTNREDLWHELERGKETVVLLGLPDAHKILEKLTRQGFHAVVLLLDQGADVHMAARAIKQGAHDAFSDPIDFVCLRHSLEELQSQAVPAVPPQTDTSNPSPPRMVGQSDALEAVRQQISEVAATTATVLILGESGTGKELVARAIHDQSHRHAGPYLPVNMAALPETLAEGALFGHRRGAFTGADRDQLGWCESANGGTLFLDEIGELDLGLQTKLLRFLETKTFQRIGAANVSRVDVRIIAATNRDPLEMIKAGQLRSDLYFRLNVYPIQLPNLSQRSEDIPELARVFLRQACQQYGKQVAGFTDTAIRALQAFHWPGNIRQLENTIHRVVISCRTETIDISQLPAEIAGNRLAATPPSKLRVIEQVERKAIVEALHSAGGNAVSAAKILGVGQATVYRKMKRYGIPLKVSR